MFEVSCTVKGPAIPVARISAVLPAVSGPAIHVKLPLPYRSSETPPAIGAHEAPSSVDTSRFTVGLATPAGVRPQDLDAADQRLCRRDVDEVDGDATAGDSGGVELLDQAAHVAARLREDVGRAARHGLILDQDVEDAAAHRPGRFDEVQAQHVVAVGHREVER